MARYQVTHQTRYQYSQMVSLSQQLLHVEPRALAWQRVLASNLHILPRPTQQHEQHDPFGNPCIRLELAQPHQTLVIAAEMQIEVLSRPQPDLEASTPWQDVMAACRYSGRAQPHLDMLVFRQESPHVHIKHDFAHYAADCFPPGRPLLAGAQALMEKIHDEFTFDAEATHIGTPLMEVLTSKRGVCQDYAHLMIACLRSLGLPARYVSGYLLTRPPPGQPRLVGADASHAWVSVWCPQIGWVDFDPTNRVIPDCQHITLAWGRDFSDVSPLRGVIIGGGAHTLEVEVTVMPLDEALAEAEAMLL